MVEQNGVEAVLSKCSVFSVYYLKLMVLFGFAYGLNVAYTSNYIFVVEEIGYSCKDYTNGTFDNSTCGSVCTEWTYENPNSFVAEFQLACQEWKRTLVGTIHSFGNMLGLLIIGPLSDKIGRKNTVVIIGVAGGIIGMARSFTTWYWVYIALEFLESAIGDNCSPLFILNMEMVATKKRVIYDNLCGIGYVLGGVLLPLAAWGVPYWRHLLQVIYAPALLFLAYFYLMDESPRWLLTQGKKEKAVVIVKKVASSSNVKIDHDALDQLLTVEPEGQGMDLVSLLKMTFGSRALLKRFLICIVWWTTSTFVGYGLMINAVSLQGNKYLNFAIVSLVDLPGNLMLVYIMNKYNRRNPLIASFLCGSILCFIQPFLPTDRPWLSILVYMISKLMSSFYFGITYIYTSELFPTHTRNSMHALCSSLGRIGSIIAPQTPLLMFYWSGLPSIVFGGMSLLAGAITFLAPDTGDSSLPDTVRQAEAVGTNNVGKDYIAVMTDIPREDKQIEIGDPKSGIDINSISMRQDIDGLTSRSTNEKERIKDS